VDEGRAPVSSAAQADPTADGPGELQSERPISGSKDDKLDRATFARRVAGVLSERPGSDSIVVGLYGQWGDGKTSALAMVKEALLADPSVVIVEYNPWFFSSNTEALTKSFFLTIGEALEQSGFFSKENIGGLLANYGGIIPKVGDAAKKLGEAMSVKALSGVRADVERILKRHKKRVVVFVDDIDRLDRKEIQTLFKLVRLSGDFPYTSYVLAFDDSVVADALGEAYGDGNGQAGRRFLEKIIQVPLHLPPANGTTLRELAFRACERVLDASGVQLEERDRYDFANRFAIGFAHALKTPRQVKLYENALTFAIPILKDEVNVVDQMLIEGIRIFYPPLYAFIRDNPARFLKDQSDRRTRSEPGSLVNEALTPEGISESERQAVQHVVEHLFPRTSGTGHGSEWDAIWAREQRICSNDYFRRYFTYAVPAGDLSDSAVDEIVSAAAARDAERLAAMWTSAREKGASKLLISKLRAREDSIPEQAIPGLCLIVAAHAHEIVRTREPLMGDMDFKQAAILIAHLLRRLPDRDELMRTVFATCPLPAFSVEVLDWCRKRESGGRTYGFLEAGELAPYAEVIWQHLTTASGGNALLDSLGEDWLAVFLALCRSGLQDTVRAYMRDVLVGDDGSLASQLIASLPGRAWLMETGVPVPTDFQRHNYDALAVVADPAWVFEKLKLRYGALEVSEYPDVDDQSERDLPRVHAEQFAFIHRAVLRAVAADPQGEVDSTL
jgi:hypothetical protein